MKNKDLLLSIIHVIFEFLTAVSIYFLSQNNLVLIIIGITIFMFFYDLLVSRRQKNHNAIPPILFNFILIKIIYHLIDVHYQLFSIFNLFMTLLLIVLCMFIHLNDKHIDIIDEDLID